MALPAPCPAFDAIGDRFPDMAFPAAPLQSGIGVHVFCRQTFPPTVPTDILHLLNPKAASLAPNDAGALRAPVTLHDRGWYCLPDMTLFAFPLQF